MRDASGDGGNVPTAKKLRTRSSLGRSMRRLAGGLLLAAVVVGLVWFGWLYTQIKDVANRDEARPADAIAVFGAAEYLGHPSPVLHARLDHAVELYEEKVAPLVITLGGGASGDAGNTEGAVGRDYLLAKGVPYDAIVAETRSIDTEEQVSDLAAIARARGLKRMVVVSDGTHLFRIQKECEAAGLAVYTSPRAPVGHVDQWDLAMRYLHEMLSYTLVKLHLNLEWLHGKVEL